MLIPLILAIAMMGSCGEANDQSKTLPDTPIPVEKEKPAPEPKPARPGTDFKPSRLTGFIGLGHGKYGYSPVGSVDYQLNQHYGLFFSRSTVSLSGGMSFRFGHIK